MILASVDTPAEATVSGATPGLTGQITVEAYDPTDGTTIIAPMAVGITEPRPGTYRTELTFPTAGTFIVRWLQPDTTAAEEPATVTAGPVPPTTPAGWRPTPDDVAALLRARTK